MSEKRQLKVVEPEQNYNLPYYEDEISITDVWLFIYRNWRTIFPIFLICLATGITAAILWPTGYSASATIKVGLRDMNKGGEATIEPMNTVRSKLEEAFIPLAIKEQMASFESGGNIKADVNTPGGNLVQIQLSGNDLSGERLLSLMQVVIGKLINEHEEILAPLKNGMKAEKEIAIIRLNQLEEDGKFLLLKLKRTDQRAKLLKQQLARGKESLNILETARRNAASNPGSGTEANTLILIGNDKQITENRKRVMELENKLYLNLDSTRDNLGHNLANNELLIEKQKDLISTIDFKISGLSMTELLVPPETSVENAAGKRIMIVLLSVVLGAILSVGISLIIESIMKAKILIQESKI